MNDVTRLLEGMQRGDPQAAEELLPLLYLELRKLGAAKMAHEPPGHTLQPTALVHEAWLRMGAADGQAWQNRSHFFAAAAEAMRRILVDRARRKRALRHGAGERPLDIDGLEIAAPGTDEELLAMHEALESFTAHDPSKAELVKLRYFAGLTFEEAAELMGISVPTAKRHWAYARAWLYREITEQR